MLDPRPAQVERPRSSGVSRRRDAAGGRGDFISCLRNVGYLPGCSQKMKAIKAYLRVYKGVKPSDCAGMPIEPVACCRRVNQLTKSLLGDKS